MAAKNSKNAKQSPPPFAFLEFFAALTPVGILALTDETRLDLRRVTGTSKTCPTPNGLRRRHSLNVGDFSEIDLVGDVAPRLAFRQREDRLTRVFPRSGRCLAGRISVAERRELRATGTSETCPTMTSILFTALASPSRRVRTPRLSVDGALEARVVQLVSALVIDIARPLLQQLDAAHDRQQDQGQHHGVLDRSRAVFALQKSEE